MSREFGDTRHLSTIRNKMKNLLVLPRGKNEGEKEARRLLQQRFYRRKQEGILGKRRQKRKRENQSDETHS